MSKHISPSHLLQLPSGNEVHPCRLIVKDGSLMWKHALLLNNGELILPFTEAHEVHIIKTAQRLEELNSWVSQDLEPWESLLPHMWYNPLNSELAEGIGLYMSHIIHDTEHTYYTLKSHILDHETLQIRGKYLFFKRC